MKVVVIEDDAALSSFLRRGLEMEGHAVACAPDGEAALLAVEQQQPELVILDLNLPRVDGIQLLPAVRTACEDAAVLVLTGRSSVEDRVRCLDGGADDYLLKPFSFHELMARCRALGRRTSSSHVGQLRHGDLQVDRVSRTVIRAGQFVDLTAKEYTLLDYLLQHRGRAVSRPELLTEVWKMPADACTNVVDVYINYLRRKLDVRGATTDLIQTVRGAGYTVKLNESRRLPVRAALEGVLTGLAVQEIAMGAA